LESQLNLFVKVTIKTNNLTRLTPLAASVPSQQPNLGQYKISVRWLLLVNWRYKNSKVSIKPSLEVNQAAAV